MTPESTKHLSEEALYDVLIGLGSPESQAHLSVCAECRDQVKTFLADVSLFNEASLAWNKSRLPRPHASKPRRAGFHAAFVGWALSAAALVAMAVGIWHLRPAGTPQQVNSLQRQAQDSDAQIAQDNQLMEAVNAAISPDEASPIEEYRILESPHPSSNAHSRKRTK